MLLSRERPAGQLPKKRKTRTRHIKILNHEVELANGTTFNMWVFVPQLKRLLPFSLLQRTRWRYEVPAEYIFDVVDTLYVTGTWVRAVLVVGTFDGENYYVGEVTLTIPKRARPGTKIPWDKVGEKYGKLTPWAAKFEHT